MPATVEALAMVVLAVVPGALYTWALEREAGRWGIGLADRALRFIGMSVVLHAVLLYGWYELWRSYLHVPQPGPGGSTVFRNLVWEGADLPAWVWLLAVAYVALPLTLGTVAGLSVHRWPRVARVLVGRDPAPRAWDHLFSPRPGGVVRLRLKAGGYVGGRFGKRSYAAGYPEEPQDLYLERTYAMDDDGSFTEGGDEGGYDEIGSGVLIRSDEIEFLEFFEGERGADDE